MISVWLLDNLEGKTGTDRKDSCGGGVPIPGGVGISLIHMLRNTRNIMVFIIITLIFTSFPCEVNTFPTACATGCPGIWGCMKKPPQSTLNWHEEDTVHMATQKVCSLRLGYFNFD